MPNPLFSWIAIFSALAASACGGSPKPEAKAPEAETAEASDAEPAEKSAEEGVGGDEAKKEPAEEEPASSSESTRHRDVIATLTAENTRFVFSFERSEAGEKAAEECEPLASKPQKKTACIAKARKKITADVLHFVKDDADQWYWITSRQLGSALKQVSKVKIEIGKQAGSSVEVISKGPGADTVLIEVPDDYTIIVPNSKHGKMVYEAKVGLESK